MEKKDFIYLLIIQVSQIALIIFLIIALLICINSCCVNQTVVKEQPKIGYNIQELSFPISIQTLPCGELN